MKPSKCKICKSKEIKQWNRLQKVFWMSCDNCGNHSKHAKTGQLQ